MPSEIHDEIRMAFGDLPPLRDPLSPAASMRPRRTSPPGFLKMHPALESPGAGSCASPTGSSARSPEAPPPRFQLEHCGNGGLGRFVLRLNYKALGITFSPPEASTTVAETRAAETSACRLRHSWPPPRPSSPMPTSPSSPARPSARVLRIRDPGNPALGFNSSRRGSPPVKGFRVQATTAREAPVGSVMLAPTLWLQIRARPPATQESQVLQVPGLGQMAPDRPPHPGERCQRLVAAERDRGDFQTPESSSKDSCQEGEHLRCQSPMSPAPSTRRMSRASPGRPGPWPRRPTSAAEALPRPCGWPARSSAVTVPPRESIDVGTTAPRRWPGRKEPEEDPGDGHGGLKSTRMALPGRRWAGSRVQAISLGWWPVVEDLHAPGLPRRPGAARPVELPRASPRPPRGPQGQAARTAAAELGRCDGRPGGLQFHPVETVAGARPA